MKQRRVLYVNATKRCNVDCPRCYIMEVNRKRRDTFPDGLIGRCLRSDFFQEDEAPTVIFQGGEVQLLGRTRLEELIGEIRACHPGAVITAVSNLLVLSDWFVEIARCEFNGRIETTWAAGKKMTLSGDAVRFQKEFESSLAKAVAAGLKCPVNVELNPETLKAGPQAVIDLALRTGARIFEFDISIDFDRFFQSPAFSPSSHPVLPRTVTHQQMSTYYVELARRVEAMGHGFGFRSGALTAYLDLGRTDSFNRSREADFVTINPDGNVTTNPLFSEIEETYLGNVLQNSLDRVLENEKRRRRIGADLKRTFACLDCSLLPGCGGGSSHVPVQDGSGECAGFMKVQEYLSSRP